MTARRAVPIIGDYTSGSAEQPHVVVFSHAWVGGAGWFVFELARCMAGAGVLTLLVCPTAEPIAREPRHPNLSRISVRQGAQGGGSKVHRAIGALIRMGVGFLAIARARLHAKTFLVTHLSWLLPAVLQFLWIRILFGSLVFVVHDGTPHAWSFPRILRGFERWLLRLTYLLPSHLVTLTHIAREELISIYGISPAKITVIPHGAYESGEPTLPPGNNKVLVFGMLRRNKRILETIEAMRLVDAASPVSLVIAGAPHAEDLGYWDECERALEGLSDRVRTEIGFVPETRIPELMAEIDAIVLPYEEFSSQSGVAILAAFAERLLICTAAGGIGELMEAGLESVTVATPVTPRTIADAFSVFAATPVAERRDMAARSHEALSEYLSWGRIAKEYVKFI